MSRKPQLLIKSPSTVKRAQPISLECEYKCIKAFVGKDQVTWSFRFKVNFGFLSCFGAVNPTIAGRISSLALPVVILGEGKSLISKPG